MHSQKLTRLATVLALSSFVSNCAGTPRSTLAIDLPPPPKFMGACPPSAVNSTGAALDLSDAAARGTATPVRA